MKEIKLISYSKSGSTYLRFILANLFWPEMEHNFDTIHQLIPSIGSEEMKMNGQLPVSMTIPTIRKTHEPRFFDENSFVLFRHPGDVLESFWHHNRKFYKEKRTLMQFIEDSNFGQEWRDFVNTIHLNDVKPYQIILYDELIDNVKCMNRVSFIANCVCTDEVDYKTFDDVILAVKKSSFENMQKIETEKGIGHLYDNSNKDINFVRKGGLNYWLQWPEMYQYELLRQNQNELRLLGYKL